MSNLTIEHLLHEVINVDASDLSIQAHQPAMIRHKGELTPIFAEHALSPEDAERLVLSVMDEDQKNILFKNKEVDFGFSFGDLGRFRVNAFYERGNIAMALRLIPNKIPSIEELRLPEVVKQFTIYTQGLVLFCGPTGSGKSSSLAALISAINENRKERIITIEDPIEFMHQSKQSIVVQREIHHDTFSFASALRSVLRQDPDIVLVGELRDLETIAAAITTAETGHLVFGTLHTNSAAQTINRIIDVFPSHQQSQIRAQLSNVLKAVCVQKLVPDTAGGRIVAAEVMLVDFAVSNLIREAKVHQINSVIQNSGAAGMQGMDQTLAKMVQSGVINYENALRAAHNPADFENIAKGFQQAM